MTRNSKPQYPWYVYSAPNPSQGGKRKHVDTVFYLAGVTANEVKRSLVEHEGYSPDIVVLPRPQRTSQTSETKEKA